MGERRVTRILWDHLMHTLLSPLHLPIDFIILGDPHMNAQFLACTDLVMPED